MRSDPITQTQYAVRLEGLLVPSGHIDADDLVAIVSGLQLLTTRIARQVTGHEGPGRTGASAESAARWVVTGIGGGSTSLDLRLGDAEALELTDTPDAVVGDRFDELFVAAVAGVRSIWASPVVSVAMSGVIKALRATGATKVEVQRAGKTVAVLEPREVDLAVWNVDREIRRAELSLTGTLFAVNTHARRFRVQDETGNDVLLVDVPNTEATARLVTTRVAVTGTAEYDEHGQLLRLVDPVVTTAVAAARSSSVAGADKNAVS